MRSRGAQHAGVRRRSRERPEPPITREDVNAIMLALMRLAATLEEIKESLLENEDDDEEEPGT
jgi:hypothetical protein